MNKLIAGLMVLLVLSGCSNNNAPDVSGIKVDVAIGRFDKDFYSADTNHFVASLDAVEKKYPYFFTDFIQHIVLEGSTDTVHEIPVLVRAYMNNSRPIYDSAQIRFSNLGKLDEELKKGFQYVKHYFPGYRIPHVVTYTGLIGDPSVALTKETMAIGLQMYLGKNFSAYNTLEAIDKFPQYISRRFDAVYIPVNCFQNIAQDIYPEKLQGLSLIEQMIEKGKQWWLVDKFMPGAADSLITGFTQSQLNWCEQNEGLVWNFIIQNYDIYTTEPTIIQNFIGEAPKTDGMPDTSPGNIGQWVGWRIVQKFAGNAGLDVPHVLQTDPKKILEAAKYKPK